MIVAYLVNQYPKVSHSFIRREIAAVENWGVKVMRFSIRSCDAELVDEADRQEQTLTRVVLGGGARGLLGALLRIAIAKPAPFFRALQVMFKIGWHSDRGLLLHIAYLAEACILLDWFAEAGVNHVHAHFGTNSTTVALLCRILGGPSYSFTVHGPEEFDKATVLGLEEKIKEAAFVVAISSFGRSQLYRWCDRSLWSKIQIVRCGLDEEFLKAPDRPIPDTPRLVCIGRLSEQKGHLLLVEAAGQLAAQGLQFKLVFVGDGPLRPAIEALITELGLQNHIEITGYQPSQEVRAQILDSRLVVLPSFAEGLPVVLMEALALKRPVISTYVAGIPELVEPGVSGWLVCPGSVSDLATAMRTALEEPNDTLEKMGKAGSQRVLQQHDAAKEACKLVDLFKQAIEKAV